MTDIRKLESITEEEVQQFETNSINTITSLWSQIGKDFNNGIDDVAKLTNISPKRLLDLLVRQTEKDKKLTEDFWLKRHSLDVGIFLGLCILIAFIFQAPKSCVSRRTSLAFGQMVVCGGTELLAYHVIRAGDVTVMEATMQPETFAITEDVIGRYPLESIQPGQPLRKNQLSKVRLAELEVKDRYLVSLSVKAGAVSPSVEQGSHISLLLSMRSSDNKPIRDSLILKDAIVLSLEQKGDVILAVVAIPQQEAKKVVPMIPKSDVFLMKPLP